MCHPPCISIWLARSFLLDFFFSLQDFDSANNNTFNTSNNTDTFTNTTHKPHLETTAYLNKMGCILSCKKNAVEEVAEAPRPVSLPPALPSPTPTPPTPDADEGHVPEAVQTCGWAGTLSGPPVGQGLQGGACGGGQFTTSHQTPDSRGTLLGWRPHPLSDVQEIVLPGSLDRSRPRKKKYKFSSNDTSELEEPGYMRRDVIDPFTGKVFKPKRW
ncbi:hypothetical protein EDD36DRAFT_85175 [Exophiala viscosa]|uniref:Uncharacterized protein n=1 Tax=Exophiala viscosa TaxID=2486360 RepID=A0AAN6DP73_9EURO|nr:hypothetical protein EDD36DRAFT_85175 [Exophiala viscosa]